MSQTIWPLIKINLFAGYAAGGHYTQTENGANYVCLTENPTWEYSSLGGPGSFTYIYGAEYEVSPDWPFKSDNISPGYLMNNNMIFKTLNNR